LAVIAVLKAYRTGALRRSSVPANLIAVNVGVLLATLHFLRRMSASVEVTSASADQEGMASDDVAVFANDGPFFFTAPR
jgi:MFS superfamily sulfate permease-like transporter